MTVSVEVPSLGESVTEAIIADWSVQEGDFVERDELIAELDTDKISVDVPAPQAGEVTSLKYAVDDEVGVGEVIAEIDPDAQPSTGDGGGDGDGDDDTTEDSDGEPAPEETETPVQEPELSPAVRRLVDQHDLDPSSIDGTGPDGRILKGDVLDHLEETGGDVEPESEADQTTATQPPETLVDRQARESSPDQLEERVEMSSLRQTIAERLVEVKNETAMLTTFNEVDMSRVIELRDRHGDHFQEEYDVKLGFMSFFVKAVIDALKRYPDVNAEIDGDEIVYKNYYHIGVAVGGPEGLVVPVVSDADQLSFAETEVAIQNKVDKVYDGSLSLDDLQGGTFTISNGGIYGSMLSTPILNPPQSAILGMHNIVDRPVAVDGEVEIRPIMYLALSYDHRVIDGKEAVSFLDRIKTCIEEPDRMLLEV